VNWEHGALRPQCAPGGSLDRQIGHSLFTIRNSPAARDNIAVKTTADSYQIKLFPDGEGGYTVVVPLLPGCTSHRRMIEEATASAREAIELHLENLAAHRTALAGRNDAVKPEAPGTTGDHDSSTWRGRWPWRRVCLLVLFILIPIRFRPWWLGIISTVVCVLLAWAIFGRKKTGSGDPPHATGSPR